MPVPEGQTGLRPYVDGAGHDIRLAGTRLVGPRLPSGRPYELGYTGLRFLDPRCRTPPANLALSRPVSFTRRKPDEVPAPSHTSRAVLTQQRLYDGFIQALDGNVGELEPSEGETLQTIKLRVRQASMRLALELEIWEADDKLYFKTATRRGRPRKSAA